MNRLLIDILEQKEVRPTAMRLLVLERFLHAKAAKSLNDLEQEMPRADRITIFRTLKTFTDRAILHAIDDGAGATRYALCDEHCLPDRHRDRHPHFHCEACGRTVCLESVSFTPVPLPAGYQVNREEYTAHGICPACKAK